MWRRSRPASGSCPAAASCLTDGPEILVYPRDRAAWGRLTGVLTIGKRRADKGDCHLFMADLAGLERGFAGIVIPPQNPDEDDEHFISKINLSEKRI